MSYTIPDGQPQGVARRMTNELREMLIGEVIAINGYQTHIANSRIETMNEVWNDVMQEEKEHYGLLLTLIRKYDPVSRRQAKLFSEKLPPVPILAQPYAPQFDRQLLLNNLRSDIKGECEAIVLYEQNLPRFPYRDVRDTVQYIVDDEKEHVEKLTQLLLRVDPDSYGPLSATKDAPYRMQH